MRVVLVYDVVDDRRRARLFRRLKQWLVPVQRSVFEGDVGDRELRRVEEVVHRELDLSEDDVRVYRLCRTCAERVRHHGVAIPLPDPDVPIVV